VDAGNHLLERSLCHPFGPHYLLKSVQVPCIVVAWIVAREISAVSLYSARDREGGGREGGREGGVRWGRLRMSLAYVSDGKFFKTNSRSNFIHIRHRRLLHKCTRGRAERNAYKKGGAGCKCDKVRYSLTLGS